MISNPFFLISMMMSAWLAFATVVVLIESSLVLLKIKNARIRSVLRSFPFVSLFLDLLFSSFSLGYWLNPLNCGSCVQKLLLKVYFPDLKCYLYSNEISLLSYLGEKVSHTIFSICFVVFILTTLFYLSRFVITILKDVKNLRVACRSSDLCKRQIENSILAKVVKEKNIVIYQGQNLIPMATLSKSIFLPLEIIEKLPQKEFEAVIAHEVEHILCHDSEIRVTAFFISSLFWWVPTRKFLQKLEFEQEIACDQSIVKYGLEEEYLASAIVKVARGVKDKPSPLCCSLSREKNSSLRRVQVMLGHAKAHAKSHEWISYGIVIIAVIIVVICTFWL